MSFITVGKENSSNIDLYYQDLGQGQPVVLIHGWPLSSSSWEKQIPVLLEAGYRVIAYDRRGFGKSSQPSTGYDYDTLAQDLRAVIEKLALTDVTLVGFSMGGGEVARYIGKYGNSGVRQAVLISSVPPYLLKADDNPEGVDGKVFAGIQEGVKADRPAFLNKFFKDFYHVDLFAGKRITEDAICASWNVAVEASGLATYTCVKSWQEDFRTDLAKITVPTLVIHGDADRIVPFPASGKRSADLIKGSELVVIEGGPHGIGWTHADEVNKALLSFLKQKQLAGARK